jgi:hypothetical protein
MSLAFSNMQVIITSTKFFIESKVDKTMEFMAQIGYFGEPNMYYCSLYGLVLMVLSVWMALNTTKPIKQK